MKPSARTFTGPIECWGGGEGDRVAVVGDAVALMAVHGELRQEGRRRGRPCMFTAWHGRRGVGVDSGGDVLSSGALYCPVKDADWLLLLFLLSLERNDWFTNFRPLFNCDVILLFPAFDVSHPVTYPNSVSFPLATLSHPSSFHLVLIVSPVKTTAPEVWVSLCFSPQLPS